MQFVDRLGIVWHREGDHAVSHITRMWRTPRGNLRQQSELRGKTSVPSSILDHAESIMDGLGLGRPVSSEPVVQPTPEPSAPSLDGAWISAHRFHATSVWSPLRKRWEENLRAPVTWEAEHATWPLYHNGALQAHWVTPRNDELLLVNAKEGGLLAAFWL